MPLYEYRCRACGRRFELIRKFSDPPLTACPTCGGEVEKLISSPAFQFKGSGWYATDYARKSESSSETNADPADKADKADKTADSSSASSEKGDGKPSKAKDDGGSKEASPPAANKREKPT